jgi:hypothetical protein
MDEVGKILLLRKKNQSADTKHPSNFPFIPQKYRRDQRMPTDLTPQKRLWSHPSEKFIHRGGGGGGGGGVDIKLNGPLDLI